MVPRENPRVKKAKDLLNAHQFTKAMKLHGSVEQERGNPDLFVCSRTGYNERGRFFVVEMKTERGKLENLQRKRLAEWFNSGADVIVSTDPDEVANLVLVERHGNWTPFDFHVDSFTISED